MTTEYDNNMRGVLFRNDKEGNPKRPDYTGNVEIEGTKYKLSAWVRTSRKGDKFLSLAVTAPEEENTPPEAAQTEITDDLPF